MSRIPPDLAAPKVEKRITPDIITQTCRYILITPLYGGGVMPSEADPVTIIRSTEVRGHLRFWWRVIHGCEYSTLSRLQIKEDEIWGSSATSKKPGPSHTAIQVIVTNRGTKFQATNRRDESINNIGSPSSRDGYVAFPLREIHNPILLENVEFEVKLSYKEVHKKEIESALWAWETFGGIGARTRRGFGAIICTKRDGIEIKPLAKDEFNKSLQDKLRIYTVSGEKAPNGLPHFNHSVRYKVADVGFKNAIDVWRFLIRKLQEFRQMRSGRFGRSRWPEPDAIRRFTGQSALKHSVPVSRIDKFPRAKFGLPIIYQFKDVDVNLVPGDPKPTTVQNPDHDRLASPLILRPIACSDGAVGLVAILEWQPMEPGEEPYTPPGGLILKGAPGDPPVSSELTQAEAKAILPLDGNTDILQAFLDSLR